VIDKEVRKMRKIFFAIWGINTAAVVWMFGSILLNGSTPDRRGLAGDFFEIWCGLAAVFGWALFMSKRKAKQAKENAAAAR
jgi:hypothetical protein